MVVRVVDFDHEYNYVNPAQPAGYHKCTPQIAGSCWRWWLDSCHSLSGWRWEACKQSGDEFCGDAHYRDNSWPNFSHLIPCWCSGKAFYHAPAPGSNPRVICGGKTWEATMPSEKCHHGQDVVSGGFRGGALARARQSRTTDIQWWHL